ncbi:MAG: diaminopimelate epimerase [Ignavibacteriaceae bacterium]|nr:diaminopimelate epimerase [Ignavibacteriaceae bacterium]
MKKILFTKMSGAGNDFIVIDKIRNKNITLNSSQISKICDRRKGIGADGLILLANSKDSDFLMHYYNADGLEGTLCGNGARCAIKFANDSKMLKSGKAVFEARSEIYTGEILKDNLVRFDLLPPKRVKTNFKIKASSQLLKSSFADTGSPHVVIEIEDVLAHPKDINSKYRNIENFPVTAIGKEIRYHKDFAPEGTNVNFIQIKNGTIYIRTYERGVENETLACGTGAVAAAITANLNKNLSAPIKLVTQSGEILTVDFQKIGNKFEKVSLVGPAKTVFTGEIDLKEI